MSRGDEETERQAKRRSRRRIIVCAIAILAVFGVISLVANEAIGPEQVKRFVERLQSFADRWWAPVALIVAFIIINLTGIPGTPLTLAAGAVWGWLAGGAWVMAAVMIGTAFPYFLVKRGFPRLHRFIEKRFSSICTRLRGHGLSNIALLRLVHVFPFAAISYAAGLANVRRRDYFAGTFIGTLPGVFIYTYLADSILHGLVSREEAALRIAIAAALLATLVVVSRWLAGKVNG